MHTFLIGTFCICLSEHIFRSCSRQVCLFRIIEKVVWKIENNKLGPSGDKNSKKGIIELATQ